MANMLVLPELWNHFGFTKDVPGFIISIVILIEGTYIK